MEQVNSRTKIQLRRALILGNFYQQKVQIITAINQGYETIIDAIVGLREDNSVVLTKSGRLIPRETIQTIYQLG